MRRVTKRDALELATLRYMTLHQWQLVWKWNELGKQLQEGADGQNMPKFKKEILRNGNFLLITIFFKSIYVFVFWLRQDQLVQNNQKMIKWILKKKMY